MIGSRKNKKVEEENADRWLLTYSDLITLLLGLFVILYAMSKIDSEKYAQLVTAFEGTFGGEKSVILQGSHGILENPIPQVSEERMRVEQEIQRAIGNSKNSNLVSVSHNERGVTIHIMEELLFVSGSADLKQSSLTVLDTLAEMLKKIPNDVRIEGHTDNVPISTSQFPSNWHLSVVRAVNTGYYMINKHGLIAEKISIVGYAEFRPLLQNTSNENKAKNRRVDIVIVTNLPSENKKTM